MPLQHGEGVQSIREELRIAQAAFARAPNEGAEALQMKVDELRPHGFLNRFNPT